MLLKELMKKISYRLGLDLDPHQLFDLMGGTSTGGLIAIMLGRLKLDCRICEEKYTQLSRKIFTPKRNKFNPTKWLDAWNLDGAYNHEILEQEVKLLVNNHLGDEEAFLFSYDNDCKV